MRFDSSALMTARVAGLVNIALCLPSVHAQQAGAGAAAAAPVRRAALPPDPRVQQRTYHFTDTNEAIPYAVFASSKVTRARKNPLIVALHGLGGNPNSLMHGNLLDLAEQGGFIVFAPMGYNPRGWYGTPGTPPAAPGATPRPPDPAAANDPPNLRELSEKDVLNVLALARKEFNVDERRTYLMGHSMGGAGTLYLGSKDAPQWAAIAAIAPAARRMEAVMPAGAAQLGDRRQGPGRAQPRPGGFEALPRVGRALTASACKIEPVRNVRTAGPPDSQRGTVRAERRLARPPGKKTVKNCHIGEFPTGLREIPGSPQPTIPGGHRIPATRARHRICLRRHTSSEGGYGNVRHAAHPRALAHLSAE
jgi:poly(3-hydroxybutyrate) depolymerase